MLKLKNESPEEIRDSAIMVFSCFTSLRIEDMDCAKTDNISVVPANSKDARHITALLEKTKNDKSRKGPPSGCTFVCPCFCFDVPIGSRIFETFRESIFSVSFSVSF